MSNKRHGSRPAAVIAAHGRCTDVPSACQADSSVAAHWDCTNGGNQIWVSATVQELKLPGTKHRTPPPEWPRRRHRGPAPRSPTTAINRLAELDP